MIKIDGITYRNLQEQVEKNKADIEDLKDVEAQASIGIVVIGELTSEDNLPDATTYEGGYGDAYLISPTDAEQYLMIFTRPTNETSENHWVKLNVETVGPQGPAGDSIESIRVINSESESDDTTTETLNNIEVKLSDGSSKVFALITEAQRGEKGEQGIQGIQGVKGDKGEKGDKGDTGAQGEIGPTAPAYHIIGIVTSTSGLPLPTTLKDLTGAYLVGDPQHLYCQVGKTLEEAIWTDLGELNLNVWEINSEGTVSPIEGAKLVQCNNLTVLGDTHLTSPNISGVVNTSAIASSDVLTLKGTNEVEIYQGDTKVIDIEDGWIKINAIFYGNYIRSGAIVFDGEKNKIRPIAGTTISIGESNNAINEAWINYGRLLSISDQSETNVSTPAEIRNAIDKVNSLYCHNISIVGAVNSNDIVINLNYTNTSSTAYTSFEELRTALNNANISEYACMGIVSNDEGGYIDNVYQIKKLNDTTSAYVVGTYSDFTLSYSACTIIDNVYQIK